MTEKEILRRIMEDAFTSRLLTGERSATTGSAFEYVELILIARGYRVVTLDLGYGTQRVDVFRPDGSHAMTASWTARL